LFESLGNYVYLLIFLARVADMSLDVLRILMLTRGKKLTAAAIGFVEVSIFLLALSQVFAGGFNDIFKVVAYAAGFATGNYVGSLIDERLAIGHRSLKLFPAEEHVQDFLDQFRTAGFGVTCVPGTGQGGERTLLYVLIKRKDTNRVLDLIKDIDPETFYSISDTREIRGGVFPGRRKGI